MRKGPIADVALIVLKCRIWLKHDDLTVPLEASPPQCALILWNSIKGTQPGKLPSAPGWSITPLPFPKNMEEVLKRPRAEFRQARERLSTALTGKGDKVDVALANALKSQDPVERMLVVRSFGAIDNLEGILNALDDETHDELRATAVGIMRQWICDGRDNDYKMYKALKDRYRPAEAENVMLLLHGFSPQELTKRESYETLIDYLTHPNLAIRQVASMDLYSLVPAGQKILYSPVADSRDRERAQREWIKLLDTGQIPPRPMSK